MLANVSVLFSLLLLSVLSSAGTSELDFSPAAPVSCNSSTPVLSCGGQSLTVDSPFLNKARDGSCIPLITCSEEGYPMLTWLTQYRVLSVDYEQKTLVLASINYFPAVAYPGEYPLACPSNGTDEAMGIEHLGYTDSNRAVTLLYNCSFPGLEKSKDVRREPCSPGPAAGPRYNYWVPGDRGLVSGACAAVNHVVVRESAIEGSWPLPAALQAGFEVTWAPEPWCNRCVESGGRCRPGYPVLHSDGICSCEGNLTYLNRCPRITAGQVDEDQPYAKAPEQSYAGTPQQINVEHKRGKVSAKFVIGVVASGGFLVVCLLLFSFGYRRKLRTVLFRKRRSTKDEKLEAFLEKFGSPAPTQYSYSDVEEMTSSFSDKLGQGRYGSVYKGKLLNGRLVAVKILNHSKGGGKEFFNEVISIGCTYHVNVVSLVGFCMEGSKRVIIYEFMPNGSLEKFIHNQKQTPTMTLQWEKLLEIAIGVARGLNYLHHGCNIGILHFDIKPHNILLDHDFCPKISDFGLAKLCRSAESIISLLGARGTVGYIAPEVFSSNFGGVSSKSDVYSYGMLVLEMVGGRKNIEVHVDNTSETYFPHWIYKHLEVDGDLKPFRVMNRKEAEIARRMIIVGLWCIQIKPADRPSMSRVLDMLEGRITELQTPPLPVLSSPSRSPQHSSMQQSTEIVSVVTR